MTLHGMDALKGAISRSPERAIAHASDAIALSTFAIANRVRAMAPRDTGRLQSSITSVTRGLNGSVSVQGDAYYWRFQEYGTSNRPARPFIRPATEEETPVFEQRIRAIGSKLERDFSAGRFL